MRIHTRAFLSDRGTWFLFAEWVGCNLIYLYGHPWLNVEDGVGLHSLAVCIALFLLPGAALFDLPFKGSRMVRRAGQYAAVWRLVAWLVFVLLASTAFQVGTLATLIALGIHATSALVWNIAWLATNIFFSTRLQTSNERKAESWLFGKRYTTALIGSTFVAAYLLYAWGATRVVPAQPDHDFEVQGTAYAWVYRGEPLLATDRGTEYYFAHPPLLHLYVALYFLYTNQLDDLKYYHDLSLRAVEAKSGTELSPHSIIESQARYFMIVGQQGPDYVVEVTRGDRVGQRFTMSVTKVEALLLEQQYLESPKFWPTRAPTVFLAALTVSLLTLWSYEANRGWRSAFAGAAVGLAYALSPEVFVRSSYGGYFGIENFAIILMLCASSTDAVRENSSKSRVAFATGLFAGLTDHKLVFLPFAFALWELVRPNAGGWPSRVWQAATFPTALGFATGICLFWLYGFSTHPSVFWLDHFHYHFIDRIADASFKSSRYPSIGSLWKELSWHTGYVLLPTSTVMIAIMVAGSLQAEQPSRQEHTPQPTAAWLLWLTTTAAAFSWIDWRQTKHLMPMLPALYLAPSLWLARSPARTWTVGLLYAWLTAYNCYWVVKIAHEFASFPALPDW